MCKHPRLIYLGAQKTDGGYNHYFKCLECSAVIIKLPSGRIFQIGGAKSEIERLSVKALID